MKNALVKLAGGAAFIGGAALFCSWQNNGIVISKSNYINEKLPRGFDNFTIAHISDLHDKMFGKNQRVLLNKLKSVKPDIIVITGDLTNKRRCDGDMTEAMCFITGAVGIAQCYYVSGNHEAWSGKYTAIKASLAEAGVFVIDDMRLELARGGDTVSIFGLSDPNFWRSGNIGDKDISVMTKLLNEWRDCEGFKILLSHRPEHFELYCKNKMDLIFTGHAHGGQVRLPFIGGVFAPSQGFLPKYSGGRYNKNSSTMFLSRGLGSSIVPLRVFNRPEIVVVTLRATRPL